MHDECKTSRIFFICDNSLSKNVLISTTILQIAYQKFRTRAIRLLVVEFLARYGFDPRFAYPVTKLPSPLKWIWKYLREEGGWQTGRVIHRKFIYRDYLEGFLYCMNLEPDIFRGRSSMLNLAELRDSWGCFISALYFSRINSPKWLVCKLWKNDASSSISNQVTTNSKIFSNRSDDIQLHLQSNTNKQSSRNKTKNTKFRKKKTEFLQSFKPPSRNNFF